MKIKKVIIKAFRLFDDVTVNLTSKIDFNKASNFVAIYAPNGFGKTSFFDAMEFCVTKSIQRVSVNFDENFKIDQQQGSTTFIHNKALPDTPVEIAMYFEGMEDIRIKCSPEDECKMLHAESQNKFFRNAILSQDWFSDFLSTKSSEERFKIFTDYFEETKNMLEYHRNLAIASRAIARKISQLKKDAKQIKKDINEKLDESIVEQINKGATALNNNGIQVSWQGKLNEKSIKGLKIESLNIANQIDRELNENILLKNKLNKLILGEDDLICIEAIEEHQKKLIDIKIDIQKITDKLQKIAQYKDVKKQAELNENKLLELSDNIKTISFLIVKYEEYYKLFKEKSILTTQKGNIAKHKQNIIHSLKENSVLKTQQEELLLKLKSEKQKLESSLLVLHERYQAYTALLNRWKELEAHIEKEEPNLKKQEDIKENLLRKSTMLRMLQSSLLNKSTDTSINIHQQEVKLIIELQNKLQLLNEKIKIVSRRITEKTKFEDDLQRLLVSSRNMLNILNGSRCPLCGHDFEEQEKLIENISHNKVISSTIEEDIKTKEAYQKEVIYQQQEIEQSYKVLISKVEMELKDNDNKITEQSTLCSNLKNLLLRVKAEKQRNENERQSLFGDLKEYTEEDKKKEIKDKIEDLIQKISEHTNTINSIRDILKNQQIQNDSLFLQTEKIDEKIISITSDLFYQEYQTKNGKEEVTPSSLELWKSVLQERQKNMSVLKALIDSEKKQLLELKLEETIIEKEVELKEYLAKEQSRFNILSDQWIRTMSFLVNDCGITNINADSDSIDIKSLYNDCLSKVLEKKQKNEKSSYNINNYINLLSLGEQYNENQKMKNKLREIEVQIEKEEQNKRIVDDERTRLQNYLDGFVKGYFQLDLINKLYNTIDPHPEYKKIRFECDFNYKEPRLNILMYSEQDGIDTIVPNLYFSTAQINLLSFCIFMAKALYAKNDNNEDLGCIFIDDPIQALDDINILSMIDLLRNIAFSLDRQIVLTTHDKNFFALLKKKVPDNLFNSRFLQLSQRGVFAEG